LDQPRRAHKPGLGSKSPGEVFFILIAEGNWAIGAAALPKAPFDWRKFLDSFGKD